jgi:hypothetical protein
MFIRDEDEDDEFMERAKRALENDGLSSEIPTALDKTKRENDKEDK